MSLHSIVVDGTAQEVEEAIGRGQELEDRDGRGTPLSASPPCGATRMWCV